MRLVDRSVALAVALLGGCVSQASMFGESRSLARERSGFEAPLRAFDSADPGESDEELDHAVRALLAEPIGPNEAIRVALARDPSLQAEFEELGIARARLLGASLPANLEFDLEARLGRGDQAGDEVEAHVVIDVTDLITLPLRRAAERASVEAAQIDAAEAVLDVALEVRRRFVAHVAARRLEAAMRDVVVSTRASYELAAALFEAGNVPRLDAVSAQAIYEESRVWLAEAELEVIESRERLVRAMGLTGDELAFEVVDRLDDPAEREVDTAAIEARTIERNLHLASIRFSLDAIAHRAGVARLEGALPELRAGVSGSVADGVPAFGPAVTVGIPLWNQGQGETRRYEAELRVAWRRYEAEALALRSDARLARSRLESARMRSVFLRDEVLPLRRSVVEETVLQYNAMQATPFMVLAARRDEVDAIRNRIRTLRDYWFARAELVHLLAGGRLDDDRARTEPTDEETP